MAHEKNASTVSARDAQPRSAASTIFAVAVVAVLLGGGSAWFVLQRGRASAASAVEASAAPKYIIRLEGFTVNLADPEDTHFLRVTMDLGVDRLPPGAEERKDASAIPTARIRDAILSVLTVGKAAPLLTPEGKAQLKKDLLAALKERVPELDVRDVYFTEFLVQR